jgi:hypothetical protein
MQTNNTLLWNFTADNMAEVKRLLDKIQKQSSFMKQDRELAGQLVEKLK